MNRDIIVFDFETGGRNPHTCQATQLAALALDGRNFKLKGRKQTTTRQKRKGLELSKMAL